MADSSNEEQEMVLALMMVKQLKKTRKMKAPLLGLDKCIKKEIRKVLFKF